MNDTVNDTAIRSLENLAGASIAEQRARRRWGVFFRVLFFGYIFALSAFYFVQSDGGYDFEHAAVISIEGLIFAGGDNDSEKINEQLRDAFEAEKVRGIIMKINSPGGSAVESNRIYKEITRLRKKYADKKIYAVVGDYCASGGYFIAAAADEIYADEASLIGSIGVIYSGFGFVGALEKLGVERRVQTAGGDKNMLDAFSPPSISDQKKLQKILDSVHHTFRRSVRDGRKNKLSAHPVIFSGAVFGGEESKRLGLIDGFADMRYVAEEIIGVEEMLYYEDNEPFEDFLSRIPVAMANIFAKFNTPRLAAGGV